MEYNFGFGKIENGQQGFVGKISVLPCREYNGADRRNVEEKGMKTL